MAASSLLCALEGLVTIAIVCLILWVIYWAATTLLATFGIVIPSQLITILRVIAVLLIVLLVVRALITGEFCGVLWSRAR